MTRHVKQDSLDKRQAIKFVTEITGLPLNHFKVRQSAPDMIEYLVRTPHTPNVHARANVQRLTDVIVKKLKQLPALGFSEFFNRDRRIPNKPLVQYTAVLLPGEVRLIEDEVAFFDTLHPVLMLRLVNNPLPESEQ